MTKIMMDYLLPDIDTFDLELPVGARFRSVMYIQGLDKITLVVEQDQAPADWYSRTFYVCKSNTEVPNDAYYVGSCYFERTAWFAVRHVFAKQTGEEREATQKHIEAIEGLSVWQREYEARGGARPLEAAKAAEEQPAAPRVGWLRRLFKRGTTDA